MTLWRRRDCFRSIEVLSSDNGFCIYDQNMEFRHGRGNGWFVLGVCSTNAVEDEGFMLEIACYLRGGTPQKEGIQVMCRENQE